MESLRKPPLPLPPFLPKRIPKPQRSKKVVVAAAGFQGAISPLLPPPFSSSEKGIRMRGFGRGTLSK